MPYKIKESTAHKVVFVRIGPWSKTILLILAGLFLIIIGAVLRFWSFESSDTPAIALDLMKILIPLVGLAILLSAIQQPQIAKANPMFITFDNQQGAVMIGSADESTETGYIRYDEIQGFDIHIVVRSSRNSNSSNRKTYYRYHVYLQKKDGGRWYLTDLASPTRAQAILQELKSKVVLNKMVSLQTKPVLSEKITREDTMDNTVLSWKNKVTLWPILYLVLFGIIFFIAVSAFFQDGQYKSLEGGAFFGLVFFLALFALILLFNIFTVIKDATTHYAVAIGKKSLEYFEYSNSQDASRNLKSLPLSEIHSISYTFEPPQKSNLAGIEVLTHQQFADAQNQQGNFLDKISRMFQRRNKAVRLNVKSMNAVECLQLENSLQDLIRKKSNLEVI